MLIINNLSKSNCYDIAVYTLQLYSLSLKTGLYIILQLKFSWDLYYNVMKKENNQNCLIKEAIKNFRFSLLSSS